MVVVGGYHSGNTRRLYQVAKDVGLPAFHVETAAELNREELSRMDEVGVTAGASTPNWMIKEVVKEPPKEEFAAVEQTELAVEEQKAKEEVAKTGGDTTAISAYRGRLFSHISKKKVNPRSKFAGTAVVRFTVGPQGELISREVTSSSGSKVLDDAAVASIDRAAPFPAMPTDAGTGPMVVSVPFKFSVR